MRIPLLLVFILPLAGGACQQSGIMVGGPGVQVGIPMRRAAAFDGDTVADRLFFGRTIPGGGSVSDDDWSAFMRDVVTPRFPAGLSVWRADGQWLDSHGTLEREQTMVVEVIHAASGEVEVSLREIADEYKRRFRQDAVLRVTTPARMRLYE